MIDVAIIGAGISGASVARVLGQYNLNVVVLEKESDVSAGTTKANSGIVHAGYDPEPGTLMAKYNVWGNKLIEELAEKLEIPYKKVGSMVLGFNSADEAHLQKLYERGVANGVPDLEILTAVEALKKEPALSKNIVAALYAPSAGVVSPYEMAIAFMDNAVTNGVEVKLNHKVTGIVKQDDESFILDVIHNGETEKLHARYVINAAGLYADEIQNMLATATYTIKANKGEYFLLDKVSGELVNHVIFQCPTAVGKGILISPTAHGNLIVGPTAVDAAAKDDVATTLEGFDKVKVMAAISCPNIEYRNNIRNFAGNRALADVDDFIVGPIKESAHFINIAGMKSPGLSSAPAIAEDIVAMLTDLELTKKENFVDTRKVARFTESTKEEWQQKVDENPLYGRIICRCERITEGEIVDAIHSPVPATTVEAVKRRVRAGSGRCQGGFCAPKVVEIIARELGIAYEDVMLDKANSYILAAKTAKGSN
ncbi:NAD(P)/FAD-dependent oxidoreductase [Candidatus Epulonipiscium viviparus]|uniref:NAD(P)/FAD-dependent oxidoreductase n=1 Tax=Candidatus Epulonipiscium viviparus TaxID=420336 RepID=UPI002738155C|nr:NAD(P)/FAD-dependent oxidoreductase [Candidatus Epulopiscium viviparus]